ncbi:sugar O-acyltransferase, sialic acid O-acetyltransferase NeuD family [Caldithrix abyssi DSM 13497]|uniref:Sugar O-acyltransferase, sialic acid O-acetyltransferase NeuD family n=1 Tax=Caldithrix abyssi DSM 13497 TaxID=880073 RepID=H1XWL7_CALAY|nr:NeuD/PglB/VioB family sugar acetyltransferase [Caldithrix abyssi]APF17779.1 sugar O-acyltransferase, sialic acid O-acetyltransferase NeuD family [Caldithrix abyssi DSM 13497]EHO41855.1 sugar O-acyltransferase, sialic acid O-acetyltransferase NeuD family [Caldithrix abyssi DSM 13497]
MKDIVIIGAGGLAREIKFLINQINEFSPTYNFLGYLISDLNKITKNDSASEILGDFTWFENNNKNIAAAVGIGTPYYRLLVANEIKSKFPHVDFPSLIHPNVIYDKASCSFEEGSIVCASSVFTVNIQVKEFALINLNCTIGHEAYIGKGSVINPTVNISGGVKIEKGVLVGTGAQILQYLTIGENATIGAGACVTKDVLPNTTVVGIPAKPLNLNKK